MMSRLLLGRELVVAEDRHVLRAGQHRGVDLPVGRRAQARGELARGERAAAAAEGVAGEQLIRNSSPPLGDARRSGAGCRPAGTCGPPPSSWMYWPSWRTCSSVKTGGLRSRLGLLAGHRHPAGADLELDRGRADADQARTAALDALGVAAVAGHAAHVEQRLALRGGAGERRGCPAPARRGRRRCRRRRPASARRAAGPRRPAGGGPCCARAGRPRKPREQTASAVVVRSHEPVSLTGLDLVSGDGAAARIVTRQDHWSQ